MLPPKPPIRFKQYKEALKKSEECCHDKNKCPLYNKSEKETTILGVCAAYMRLIEKCLKLDALKSEGKTGG